MSSPLIALLLTLVVKPSSPADMALDPAALAIFREMLRRNRNGFGDIEEAAFIVRGSGGELIAVPWPGAGEPDRGRWEGSFPAGVVAIAHTHPAWLPMPSSIDAATARRARIPVYVITASRISMTSGGEGSVVIAGDWQSP